jgi:hypothetical protein
LPAGVSALRATERYAQTPVIIMTSSPSRIIEEKAIRHAALLYLQKPSTLAQFMDLGGIIRRETLSVRENEGDAA